jgi:RNA polymerase sigma-70 factor (ECF subfamily)
MSDVANRHDTFERYVLSEVEVLLRVARSLAVNHAEAEDLLQDTIVRAWRGIDRFDGRHPRAWLFTIMRNAHASRHRRRRPRLLTAAEIQSPVVERGPHHLEPDHSVEQALRPELDAALAALPGPFRAVVVLVDIDGLSYEEAAAVLGVPVGTVMSRLHRARRRMRDHLGSTLEARG